jgi:hypothetical protein
MKSIINTILASVFVAVFATSASAAPPGKGPLETTIHKSPMTLGLATTSATSQQYTCPMHPEVVKDAPGKCPKCGMKLVEKNDAKKDGKCCGNGIGQH